MQDLLVEKLSLKKQFPYFVKNPSVTYLDSAATAHKPQVLVEALSKFYSEDYATVHRTVYEGSSKVTGDYENVRKACAQFIHAGSDEIVFTRGTTHALNLLATTLCMTLKEGQEVLVTATEHHANLVSWQLALERFQTKEQLKVAKIDPLQGVTLESIKQAITDQTRIIALPHISNTLGLIHPIKEIAAYAKERGITIVVDGAQAVGHIPVDVQELGVDFYVASAHKMYGPTGLGLLYGRKDLLDHLTPYEGGGDMIDEVSWQTSTYQKAPYRFEAGTPNIAGVIAFGAVLSYLNSIGMDQVYEHEKALTQYLYTQLNSVPGIKILGGKSNRSSIVTFVIDECHALDVGVMLSLKGVYVRTGKMCAEPFLKSVNTPYAIRASVAMYNSEEDIDKLIESLLSIQKQLKS